MVLTERGCFFTLKGEIVASRFSKTLSIVFKNHNMSRTDVQMQDVQSLDDVEMQRTITLISKERDRFIVSEQAAKRSELIMTSITQDDGDIEIPLPLVESSLLPPIVEYLEYHVAVEPWVIKQPLKSSNLSTLVDPWDFEFINRFDMDTMFKILLVANYMHIHDLLMLFCAHTASLMKGKTPAQIRETFGIDTEFTKEEEEQLREEYRDLLD